MNVITLAVRAGNLPKYHEAIFTKAYDPTDITSMTDWAERIIDSHTDFADKNKLYLFDSGSDIELRCVCNAARELGYEYIHILRKDDKTGEYYAVGLPLQGED